MKILYSIILLCYFNHCTQKKEKISLNTYQYILSRFSEKYYFESFNIPQKIINSLPDSICKGDTGPIMVFPESDILLVDSLKNLSIIQFKISLGKNKEYISMILFNDKKNIKDVLIFDTFSIVDFDISKTFLVFEKPVEFTGDAFLKKHLSFNNFVINLLLYSKNSIYTSKKGNRHIYHYDKKKYQKKISYTVDTEKMAFSHLTKNITIK